MKTADYFRSNPAPRRTINFKHIGLHNLVQLHAAGGDNNVKHRAGFVLERQHAVVQQSTSEYVRNAVVREKSIISWKQKILDCDALVALSPPAAGNVQVQNLNSSNSSQAPLFIFERAKFALSLMYKTEIKTDTISHQIFVHEQRHFTVQSINQSINQSSDRLIIITRFIYPTRPKHSTQIRIQIM